MPLAAGRRSLAARSLTNQLGHRISAMSVLPLRQAYDFMTEHGLEEIEDIRSLPKKEGFHYMTGARRGLFINVLNKKGLLQQFISEHWPGGNTSAGQRMIQTHLRRYDDYLELDREDIDGEDEGIDPQGSSFAYEADLQRFLAKNLQLVEPGLRLYEGDSGPGIEYPVDRGRIDILAVDRNGTFVVIELKLSRGRSKALGQILYYIGWVDKHLDATKPCRGVIVAREVSEELLLACRRIPGLELFQYELQVSLRRAET